MGGAPIPPPEWVLPPLGFPASGFVMRLGGYGAEDPPEPGVPTYRDLRLLSELWEQDRPGWDRIRMVSERLPHPPACPP